MRARVGEGEGGWVYQKTRLSQRPAVDNAQQAVQRLEAEQR